MWPWLVAVIVAGILGAPIFALLGGMAMFAFFVDGSRPVVPLIKAYEELTSPTANLAAIPLFTLAGLMFAEGKSSERLLRALRAFFGWFRGGTAVAAATLCAFFTLFTGGSGVTILALGGLLLPALLKDGYRERFSMGLLTASGSLGLLFPLSVPLILYGIVAQSVAQAGQEVAIEDLFIGGLLPGLLMLGLVSLLGVREAITVEGEPHAVPAAGSGIGRVGSQVGADAARSWCSPSCWAALRRRLNPPPSRRCTPCSSSGSCTATCRQSGTWSAYPPTRWRWPAACSSSWPTAVGLTNYLVNAQIPMQVLDWTKSHIESRIMFLLALNVFLLLVGTVMDIFSAIVVVVPLIVPLALAYDISLVHLGIIFIANLELGYLHPPLGLNLLLASYRFGKSVLEVTWATLPMLGILIARRAAHHLRGAADDGTADAVQIALEAEPFRIQGKTALGKGAESLSNTRNESPLPSSRSRPWQPSCSGRLTARRPRPWLHLKRRHSSRSPIALTFRNVGPFRTAAWVTEVAVPETPARDHLYTIYAATRSGGLWKTTNAGTTWTRDQRQRRRCGRRCRGRRAVEFERSSGWAPATRPTRARRTPARASSSPRTPARPGSSWAFPTPITSRASSFIRTTRTSSTSRRWAICSRRTKSAACSAR